jgi:hypothetical protein
VRAKALLLVAACALGACAPPSSSEPDAGAPLPSDFPLELGTGRETFQPLADGDTVYLEAGFQGLQHVLASVRSDALAEGRYMTDFSLVHTDGTRLSEASRVRAPYADAGGEVSLTGYRVVVGDDTVDAAVGAQAVLRVVVEDGEGGQAADERRVQVEWAPEGWDPDAG